MGDYYNKTRAPLGISLRRGGSVAVAPKTWCFIAPQDEGTAGLVDAVRKGFLVRALVPRTDMSTPAKAVVASVTAAPAVAAEPSATPIPENATTSVSQADPKAEPAGSSAPVIDSKQSRRNK